MGLGNITSAITQCILLSALFMSLMQIFEEFKELFSQLSGHKNISRCLNLLFIFRNQEAKKKHTVQVDKVLT